MYNNVLFNYNGQYTKKYMHYRYAIRLSFIAVFLTLVGLTIYYRYNVIKWYSLIPAQKNARNIVSKYRTKFLNQNHNKDIISKLVTNSYDLKLDLDLKNLAKQSLNFFREIEFMESIEQITLYDSMKNIIIRSKDDYVATNNVRKNIGIENLLLYLDKLLFYTYQKPNQNPTFKHGARITNCFVEFDNNTYPSRANTSPFSANVLIHCESPIILDHTVIAFLKITYNATQQWIYINNISKQVLTILLLMSLIFFFIIKSSISNVQQIINVQLNANKYLEQARQKAEKENIAKNKFLANVSHELRTPLSAIIGLTEIILSNSHCKINYYNYIRDIHNSGKHLLAVINDILDFSKASANKLTVENVAVDLNKLAASSLRLMYTKAKKAGIKLISKFPPDQIIINADAKRLKQALFNLLSNSIKFTPSKGSITLEISMNELKSLVYIKVIDTGIGIAEHDIPKALSSFEQVNNNLSNQREGTGLGLPLTKKLIYLMEGDFEITSNIGQGTTVTITFKYPSRTIN